MSIKNITLDWNQQAFGGDIISFVQNGGLLTIKEDKEKGYLLEKETALGRVWRRVIPTHHSRQMTKLIQILSHATTCDPADPNKQKALQKLKDRIIVGYKRDSRLAKIIEQLDRRHVASKIKKDPDIKGNIYLTEHNSDAYRKWVRYLGGDIANRLTSHPDLANWLEQSKILSQIGKMPLREDTFAIEEGELKLKVTLFEEGKRWDERESRYMGAQELNERFDISYCRKRKGVFLKQKGTDDVYTFLSNKKGLQKFDPFDLHHDQIPQTEKFAHLVPITQLTDEDLKKAQAQAAKFERPKDGEKRDFVLQVVSSYVEGLEWNLTKLVQQPKHPYLRIIIGKDNEELGTKKGDVYEVGYGWKSSKGLPFKAKRGRLTGLDMWEFMPCKEKVVTYIPLSQTEANSLFKLVSQNHNQGRMAFHLRMQNCSVFVRNCLKKVNIPAPTELSFIKTLHEVAPDWIRAIGKTLSKAGNGVYCAATFPSRFLPNCVNKPVKFVVHGIAKVALKTLEALVVLTVVAPIAAALGELSGKEGRAFPDDMGNGEKKGRIQPTLKNFAGWFSFSAYSFNFPGVLQRWQRELPSTCIHENPQRLTLLPPENG